MCLFVLLVSWHELGDGIQRVGITVFMPSISQGPCCTPSSREGSGRLASSSCFVIVLQSVDEMETL